MPQCDSNVNHIIQRCSFRMNHKNRPPLSRWSFLVTAPVANDSPPVLLEYQYSAGDSHYIIDQNGYDHIWSKMSPRIPVTCRPVYNMKTADWQLSFSGSSDTATKWITSGYSNQRFWAGKLARSSHSVCPFNLLQTSWDWVKLMVNTNRKLIPTLDTCKQFLQSFVRYAI